MEGFLGTMNAGKAMSERSCELQTPGFCRPIVGKMQITRSPADRLRARKEGRPALSDPSKAFALVLEMMKHGNDQNYTNNELIKNIYFVCFNEQKFRGNLIGETNNFEPY